MTVTRSENCGVCLAVTSLIGHLWLAHILLSIVISTIHAIVGSSEGWWEQKVQFGRISYGASLIREVRRLVSEIPSDLS